MAEKSWKRAERRIAAKQGGERVPVSGRARGDVPDIAHPTLAVEVKERRALPLWLKEALAQAIASAGDDQLPLVVLHQHGQRHDDDLCILRLRDFAKLAGISEGQKEANKHDPMECTS